MRHINNNTFSQQSLTLLTTWSMYFFVCSGFILRIWSRTVSIRTLTLSFVADDKSRIGPFSIGRRLIAVIDDKAWNDQLQNNMEKWMVLPAARSSAINLQCCRHCSTISFLTNSCGRQLFFLYRNPSPRIIRWIVVRLYSPSSLSHKFHEFPKSWLPYLPYSIDARIGVSKMNVRDILNAKQCITYQVSLKVVNRARSFFEHQFSRWISDRCLRWCGR